MMSRYFYLSIFIFAVGCISFFSACPQKTVQISELLIQADSLMYPYTDSAEYILDKIADSPLSDRQKADYWRLRTKAHIMKGKSTVEDSMIIFSLDYYKRQELKEEMKESYKLALNHFSWKNDSSSYNRLMREAENYAEQNNDSLFTYIIFRSIANDCRNAGDYEAAYRYYVKASEYDSSYPSTFYMAALSLSSLDDKQKLDSLDYWINRAIQSAKEKNDIRSLNHYYRNYADILIKFEEYDKAINNIRMMKRYGQDSLFSAQPYMMAKIFLQKHELDSAQYYLDKMLEQDFGTDENRSFMFTRKGLGLFQEIINFGRGGKIDLGIIGRLTDSLYFNQANKDTRFEEQVSTKQRLERQNLELKIKKQQTQLLLLTIVFLLTIGSIAIYYYIRRKKEKLYLMEEKMDSLEELLADVSDNLRTDRENSSYVKKILLQQLGLIRFAATNPTPQNQEILQRMMEITYDKIPDDSFIVWDDLYTLIDSLYDRFYSKMKDTFATVLTEKDMQLCCLMRADFSTKEISVITRQGIRTIYQRKSRLREKLKMKQGEDITRFIEQNATV